MNKQYTYLLILALIVFASFWNCGSCQVRVMHASVHQDGGHPHPVCDVDIFISPSNDNKDNRYYRNDIIYLKLTLTNKDKTHDIPSFKLKAKLTTDFENISNDKNLDKSIIEIKFPSTKTGETQSSLFPIQISKKASLNNPRYIMENNSLEIDQPRNYRIVPNNPKPCQIYILNNKPNITSASVTILSQCIPANKTLYLLENSKNISTSFSINAMDVEDEDLKVIWTYGNNKIISSETIKNDTITLPEGEITYFTVRADDGNNYSDPYLPKILYNGNDYEKIIIPTQRFYQNVVVILVVFTLFILSILKLTEKILPRAKKLLIKLVFFEKLIISIDGFSKKLLAVYPEKDNLIILVLWLSILSFIYYILLFYIRILSISAQPFTPLGYPIAFNYLYFFELYIFLFVFICISYFNKCCFKISGEYIISKLWLINLVFMVSLLFSLGILIPQIDPVKFTEHLHTFYTTVIQAFATIIAIVAAMSPGKSMHNKNVIKNFIMLYTIIIVISFSGLISFASISFNPVITNIVDLLSISIFEITLLLIPPALISLHELYILHSTLEGNI